MIFCYFCFSDTFSAIDAFLKLILVITGSALIICFCHRLTNYKKSRRYKSSSGCLQPTSQPNLHHDSDRPAHFNYLAASGHQQHHHQYYDPHNNRPPQFSYANSLLGTPTVDPTMINYHSAPLDNHFGHLRGSDSALLRDGVPVAVAASMLPHLIANPVYSSTASYQQQQQQLSGIMLPGENHPLLDQDDRRVQSGDCQPDGIILDACPSYEEAIASIATSAVAENVGKNSSPILGEQQNSISSNGSHNNNQQASSANQRADQEEENFHQETDQVSTFCEQDNPSEVGTD